MRTLLTLLLFSLSTFCFSNDYGETWTKIIQCNRLQAKIIVLRYKLANIGQEISKNESGYYIEFNYEDDDIEKFWDRFYCVPKRLYKKIQIIEFILIDNRPIDLGKKNNLIL